MTFWELQAGIDALNRYNGNSSKEGNPEMTDEQYDELCALGDKWSAENERRAVTRSA